MSSVELAQTAFRVCRTSGPRHPCRRITLGVDKAYDVTAFVEDLRRRQVTRHIAINGRVSKNGVVRLTAVDGRATRHFGNGISQIYRKRIEEAFGSRHRPGPRE